LFRKCGNFDVSQRYGPPRPVTGIALPVFTFILIPKFKEGDMDSERRDTKKKTAVSKISEGNVNSVKFTSTSSHMLVKILARTYTWENKWHEIEIINKRMQNYETESLGTAATTVLYEYTY
jgi:hypothetical protein